MDKWKDMLMNGCNIVYCTNERERNDFVKRFLDENPEYTFEMRAEFMDLKKRLFGSAPSTFKILLNSKRQKKKQIKEEIVGEITGLLKKLEIYYLADRVPRAMSLGQRSMCSVAMDILESEKNTFLLSEDEKYSKETLKGIAACVRSYTWTGELKFVWVTDTAHQDAEIRNLCDGLFELNEGKLIKHELKKESDSAKKESPVSSKSAATATGFGKTENVPVAKTTVKSQSVPKPKLISKDRMPLPGKVCRLSDGSEGIVLAKKYSPIRGSECYEFSIRELKTGEVSQLTVMWTRKAENPTYYSFYKSSYPRAGANASRLGDFICYYEQETRNETYESYEADLRYCTYLGDYRCKDLFTGETYRPEVNGPIRKELDMVKTGDIMSVCLYGGKQYFGGSYQKETIVSLYASSNKGTLGHYNAASYGFLWDGTVYTEKDGRLVETSCEKEKLYILHRVCMLKAENHDMYIRYGIDSPLVWVLPAKGQIKYGLLKGNVNEWKWKTLTFTPFQEEDSYTVNKETFDEESFEYLCKKAIPVKAEVFEVDDKLAILSEKSLERQLLSYTYQDGNTAVCMDLDTYELTEIPCADLPMEITEGCTFEYYPEIKYATLVEMDASDEEEPVAESITTYEGYDVAKQAHIIRIVDSDGSTAEYTYGDDEIEFTEDGITKGMRVSMRLSFNDDTCSLNVHLSKYKG